MRILLVSLLLLALPCWAIAGDEAASGASEVAAIDSTDPQVWDAGCLTVPNGCSIDQVGIELSCCPQCDPCFEGYEATVRVEFFDEAGAILGMGDVKNNWCNPCPDCRKGKPLATFGKLDKAVDPCKIASARILLVGGPEGGINVKTLTLWLRDPQGRLGVCEKWYKAWKCSPECCQVLGGNTRWDFTSNGCCKQSCGGCNKCESKCGSKCGGCNKCESKCGSKCGGCNKCDKPKCGSCKDKCGCKSKCESKCGSCNKCEKPKCGCKDKCGGKCGSKCGGDKCGGCNKCAKPKCGCNKCETKCKPDCGCNKCAKPKCGCKEKCGGCNKCGSKCKTDCGCKQSKCACGKH